MEIQELIKRYQAKKRDFSWVSLSQANLTGLNLSDSNFYGANLSETNLENANLSNVNFARTNLQKANLRNANLTKVKLYKTNLDDADLTNADLTGVIFNHHVSLNNTIMPDGTPYEQWLLCLDMISNPQKTEFIENNETYIINNNYTIEETPISSQNVRTKTSNNLPIATLILLGLGYVFIGIVLAGLQQPLWSWLIILASSIIWLIHESLITFIPLIPALTIILSTFQIFAVLMMGVLFVMAMGGMSVFFGFRKGAILRDGIWVSTI
ncbi:MAG TPA: pentapeptide repeat-containing protein, partial [Allocoleopsis sp.]